MSKHIQIGQQRGGSPIIFKSGDPVSVICVAATFTGVSYANNGGKVQLSSAGVHGLTTSPAVGASVYVSWSGGTGVNGLYKVLSVDSTTAITIDLTYVTGLGTPSVVTVNSRVSTSLITIPPLLNNSEIRCAVMATVPKTTSTRAVFIILNNNTSARVSSYISSPSVGSLRAFGSIKNQGVTNQQINSAHVSLSGSSTESFLSSNIDTSGVNYLSIELQSSAANELLKIEEFLIEVFL